MIASAMFTIFGLALTLASSPAAAAAAGSTPSPALAPRPARPVLRVSISSSLAGAEAAALESAVEAVVLEKLWHAGILSSNDAPTLLAIEISRDEAADDLTIQYGIASGGRMREALAQNCHRCGSNELLEAIEADLERLGPVLTEAARPRPTVVNVRAPSRAPMEMHPRRERRLGPLGIGGIVGLAVGVALVTPGAYLAAVAPERGRSVAPGYALIGVGAALVVSGAVVLGLDLGRRATRSRAPALGRLRLSPTGLAVRW